MTTRRPPPVISAVYLSRVTAFYLDRHFTTSGHLRRLLMTRVTRAVAHHGTDPREAEVLVDAEIDRLNQLGALDDRRFAVDKAQSLRRRGSSTAKIRSALHSKRLSSAAVDAALAEIKAEEPEVDAEWVAACTWARKRRLGPWRMAASNLERRRAELSKMGRAGFSYDIARRIVDADDPSALER